MNQREKIANNFSDAYLLAMLEGIDTSEVTRQFSRDFPEMASQFEESANSLNMLYGDLKSSEKPSENEIAGAYKKVSERLGTSTVRIAAAVPQPGFFAHMRTLFSASPMWAGASLGIGVAVVIALLWQPWVIKQSLNETAHNAVSPANTQGNPVVPPDFAVENQAPADPMKMPEVQYRGPKSKQILTPAQKKLQDSFDAARLLQMTTPKPLAAPLDLRLEPLGPGAIMIRWSAVGDALSYIVEMKSANDDTYHPVTQISQTGARITSLESGKTYFVRVLAASGERLGPASDAKSIIVQ